MQTLVSMVGRILSLVVRFSQIATTCILILFVAEMSEPLQHDQVTTDHFIRSLGRHHTSVLGKKASMATIFKFYYTEENLKVCHLWCCSWMLVQ